MPELLVPPEDITREVSEYGEKLSSFISSHRFPSGLLSSPDHVMIKSATPGDFGKKAREIKDWAEYMAFTQIDWRFLVAARLIVPLSITRNRPVSWVEIMEAKSPDGTADYIGAEYTTFFFDNLGAAEGLIRNQQIPMERRADGAHKWLSININDQGQELRITDKCLTDTIDKELDDQTAWLI